MCLSNSGNLFLETTKNVEVCCQGAKLRERVMVDLKTRGLDRIVTMCTHYCGIIYRFETYIYEQTNNINNIECGCDNKN